MFALCTSPSLCFCTTWRNKMQWNMAHFCERRGHSLTVNNMNHMQNTKKREKKTSRIESCRRIEIRPCLHPSHPFITAGKICQFTFQWFCVTGSSWKSKMMYCFTLSWDLDLTDIVDEFSLCYRRHNNSSITVKFIFICASFTSLRQYQCKWLTGKTHIRNDL